MCARRAGVALPETIEDIWQELRRDANPAVGHREPNGPLESVECHTNPSAGGREFQRVRQEVPDDLLQAIRVAHDGERTGLNAGFEIDVLGPCRRSNRLDPGVDDGCQIDAIHVELQLAGDDAGDVEQVADDPRLRSRVALDDVEGPRVLRLRDGAGLQHADPPVDRVQGRAQLVRDRHQELVLQTTRRFQLRACLLLASDNRAQLRVGGGPRGRALVDAALERIVRLTQRLGARGTPPLVALEQHVHPHQQRAHEGDDRNAEPARPPHGTRVFSQTGVTQAQLLPPHVAERAPHAIHHDSLLDGPLRPERAVVLVVHPLLPEELDLARDLRAQQLEPLLLVRVVGGERGEKIQLPWERAFGLVEGREKLRIAREEEPAGARFCLDATGYHRFDIDEHLFGADERFVRGFGPLQSAKGQQRDGDEHCQDSNEARAQERWGLEH